MTDLLTIHHGDAIAIMKTLPDNSVDSVVTDPPYALQFMGAKWDQWQSAYEFEVWCGGWASECLRVLKPGGHLLSFGGSRTWHRLTSGIEDAGFDIRDSIAWLHSNGYPKSHDVAKSIDKLVGAANGSMWEGWGTALKPAHEPIVVARKPFPGTVARNVMAWGTGAMNIDDTRVESRTGRWPSNVLLDDVAAEALDEESGVLTSGKAAAGGHVRGEPSGEAIIYGGGKGLWKEAGSAGVLHSDSGGASRFFPTFPAFRYQAKAPKAERPVVDGVAHATVKPLALMRWLVRLVTPPGGIVLDPFVGSGTTAEACVLEGLHCIAIEREEKYLPLIEARMERIA